MAGWGDGAPVRHHHDDYALREHGHLSTEISGAPDDGTGDYVTHDELEDRLREFRADHDNEIDDNFARRVHDHDELDALSIDYDELTETVAELQRDRDELKRDRAAMIRRMRLIEEALRLAPPYEFLTSQEDDTKMRCQRCGRVAGMPTVPCPICPDAGRPRVGQ